MTSADKHIRAWTFTHEGYPNALRRSTLTSPSIPAATEIHVRVKAAALNPVDIQLMNLPVWRYLPRSFVSSEKGIGEDFSGIVEAAGGTLQDVISVNTKSSIVIKKPQDMSWEQAAALPLVWLTGNDSLQNDMTTLLMDSARTTIANVESYVQGGGRLVVLGGSSAVGMFVLQIASERGWEVLTTCSSRNADFVKSMGATSEVDYNTDDVAQAVREYSPAAIIDCVGGTSCIGLAKRYVTIVGDKTGRDSMGGAAIYLWNPKMVIRTLFGRVGLGKSYDCVNLEYRKEWLEESL
ncbi:GroES-like protein, partial [Aureobasidium sp. EXF-8845]